MHLSPEPPSLNTCRQCAAPLPAGSPAGHCPACLCRVSLCLDDAGDEPDGQSWTRLGDCDLYEELGRGGMGIVYRARHRRLGQPLAVKVLRGGEIAEPGARRRFQAEAETAARLQHPGIVAIHDVGEEQGVCWYSMELIAGRTLDDVVRQQPMPARDAALCLRDIAAAVTHAHAHGVLHRDLKPSNIILDVESRPHVTDFGIARCMDRATAATRTGAASGSPGYAAPEQIHGTATDARTDVYGLGGILYHVLTGRAPFQGPTPESILMQMRDRDPLGVRQLNPAAPRDLETICLKCLTRDPARRYATAALLREDLERFLDGLPILARPSNSLTKIWSWCRRRPALAAALMLAALAISGGTMASLWSAAEARLAKDRALASEAAALKSEHHARRTAYAATLLRAQSEIATGSPRASELLSNLEPDEGKPDLRHWEWHYLHGLLDEGEVIRTEPLHQARRSVAWAPDGRTYATAVCTGPQRQSAWAVAICDGRTNAEIRRLPHGEWDVAYLSWHPDGKRLATADDTPVDRIWDVTTGTLLSTFVQKNPPPDPAHYNAHLIAWSPDGQWLATAINGDAEEGGLRIQRASDGMETRRFPGRYEAMSWHPDSTRIAASHFQSGLIELHSVTGGTPPLQLAQPDGVCALAFNQAGLLAAGTYSSYLKIINPLAPGAPVPSLITNQSVVRLIHWMDADRSLLTGGWNGLIAKVDASTVTMDHYLWGHDRLWLQSLSVHGDTALTWADDGTLRRWQTGQRQSAPTTPAPLTGLQWVGGTLFPGCQRPADAGGVPVAWQPQANGPLQSAIIPGARNAVWSPDGEHLAVIHLLPEGAQITIRLRTDPNAVQKTFTTTLAVRDVLWSPGGDRLLLASHRAPLTECVIVSVAGGHEICRLPAVAHSHHHLRALPIAWSPDGTCIALWGGGVIYNATTGQPTAEGLALAKAPVGFSVESITWSPDGTRLAIGGADYGNVAVLSLTTGKILAESSVHNSWVLGLSWHPTEPRLATASKDGTVKILDSATLEDLLVFTDKATDGCAVAWSPDGQSLANAAEGNRLIIRSIRGAARRP